MTDQQSWSRRIEAYLDRVAGDGAGHGPISTEVARPAHLPGVTNALSARPVLAAAAHAVVAEPHRVIASKVVVNRLGGEGLVWLRDPDLVLGDLPVRPVKPVPARIEPVPAGDVMLWPHPASARAFVSSAAPKLLDAAVTIERNPETLGISGGSATLTFGATPAVDQPGHRHEEWAERLTEAGHQPRAWRFLPMHIHALTAELELPVGHVQGEPRVSTNPDVGTATVLVDLTPQGAAAWHQALTAAPRRDVGGLIRLTPTFYVRSDGNQVEARQDPIAAPLGPMLRDSPENVIHTIDPEVSLEAVLVVDGHPTIETVTVDLRSSTGLTHTEVFGENGGRVVLRLTSTELARERIDWTARVSFRSGAWPPVRDAGTLSSETGGWSELVVPSSWIRHVSVTAMLVGEDGAVLPEENAAPQDRVTGSIDFTAAFLESSTGLHTSFETASQERVSILMPAPPGQPPGDLKLTVMALRDGRDALAVRALAPDEQWALVRVAPDARIQVTTNKTPAAEKSLESVVGAVLDRLAEESASRSPSTPVVQAPATASRSGPPPVFEVYPGENRYYVLEVAIRPELLSSTSPGRTPHDFWSSEDLGALGAARFAMPEEVWARLRHAGELFYRVWTTRTPDGWVEPGVS
ncbi:MAG: hypothetical protein AB1425_11155, partial [Actinomycetota bacterium]